MPGSNVKEFGSKVKTASISMALCAATTIVAAIFLEIITRLPEDLQEKLSTRISNLLWWEILLILLLASAIGVLTEKVGARKVLPFAFFCIAVWLAISLIGKAFYGIDFHFAQVSLAFILPIITIHLKTIWQIDKDLTEKLFSLSSFSYLFDAKTAEKRIETTLKLLQTTLSPSEAIVFYITENGLKPVGRMRKGGASLDMLPSTRQAAWREKITFCEEALLNGETRISKNNDQNTKIAVPLISENEEIGVLYVEVNTDFEEGDKNLLEAISEQLARNFQRKEIREKSFSSIGCFFSSKSARNRVELLKIIKSNIKEQSFIIIATSHLKEAFAVAYLDGTIAYMDPQMRILSGLKDQPLAEIDLFQLLEKFKTETFNEPNLALRKILQTGETYENELFFENTGKTLKIQINLVEAFFDNETSSVKKPACFLVVIDDITVIKENEKLRSDMVNLMSHEIRTPITSIQGFAELLLADETIDSEKKEFLSIIAKESQRLSRMLTTFLSIAKLEQSDKKEFQKIPVKIDYIVSEVVREMQEKAKRKRIRLVEKSDSHLPPIAADKGLITKAIMHLVDNAIKYSPERTSVIISTALETEYLRVTVEDRGYGIPKDEQEKIWQKFYRIAREGQDKEEESTGLGLALVKEIVEKHGGQVEVESEVGFGSKFTVRLPRL